MKIVLKRNGTGTIKEFENKEELLDFAGELIERRNVIDNDTQAKIVGRNKNLTISEIVDEIDYTRVYKK